MTDDTLFPHEVAGLWEQAVGPLPEWLDRVVKDYAPPVSTEALDLVTSWARDPRLTSAVGELSSCRRIARSLPARLYTTYPLFGSHYRLSRQPNCNNGIHDILTKTVGGNRVRIGSPDLKPATYYQDCLTVRKALAYLLENPRPELSPQNALITMLKASDDTDRLSPQDRTRCLGLLRRDRKPGERSHIRAMPHNRGHLERIPRLTKPSVDRHEFSTLEADLSPAESEDEPIPGYRLSGTKTPRELSPSELDEPSDPDKPDQYRRHEADFRSRGDDRHALRQLPWLQSVRDTRSPADVHRLPLEHVAEAIRGIRQRKKITEWAFTWVLATTGISERRLAKLTVHDGDEECNTGEMTVRVNTSDLRLEIPLIDGPSGPPSSPSRVVRLPLPRAIVSALRAAPSCQPFLHAPGNANHALRRHFAPFPGLTPTCQRIRATAEAVIQGLASDSVTGLTLKGGFGHSSRGAAAYRQTSDRELADLHGRVCRYWQEMNPLPERASPDALPVPALELPGREDGYVGSRKVAELGRFREAFRHLEGEIQRLIELTHRQKGTAGVEVDTLLDLQHAHARSTYLALLLSTGIRPISTRATIRLAGNYWYVQDKDSPDFSERRAIPAMPAIVDQVVEQQAFTRSLLDTQRLRRSCPAINRKVPDDAPLWLEKSGRVLRVRRMRQSDIGVLFQDFDLDIRASRHTFTTTLRPWLPETELHAMLGHSGGGWQRESLMSMGEDRYTDGTRQAIEEMLQKAGFRLINPAGHHAI